MKCPVCSSTINDNSQICKLCAWEFKMYVGDISKEEENLYNEKLKIARQNWQKLVILEKKMQSVLKASSKTKAIKLKKDQNLYLQYFSFVYYQ